MTSTAEQKLTYWGKLVKLPPTIGLANWRDSGDWLNMVTKKRTEGQPLPPLSASPYLQHYVSEWAVLNDLLFLSHQMASSPYPHSWWYSCMELVTGIELWFGALLEKKKEKKERKKSPNNKLLKSRITVHGRRINSLDIRTHSIP